MSELKFRTIRIISLKEKRARVLDFHPETTTVIGENDTGKSSLIKTLYRTFGAIPAKQNEIWLSADACSVVDFTVGDVPYSILHFRSTYGVFDAKQKLLCSASSVTKELAPFLSDLFKFKLTLVDKGSEKPKIPTPAFLFLPFYVDQDAGWSDNWNSFSNLQQFKNYRLPVVEYHTGIRPNEYYQLKAEIELLTAQKTEKEKDFGLLQKMLDRQKKRLGGPKFSIDFDSFEKEIRTLLVRCTELAHKEQEFKELLVDLNSNFIRVRTQKDLVLSAAKELKEDYKFLNNLEADSLDCPTCGAHYDDTFPARLDLAKDEGRCLDLLSELTKEESDLSSKIQKATLDRGETSKKKLEIEEMLASKKAEVTLRDLIQSKGQEELGQVIGADIDALIAEIETISREAASLGEKLKTYTDVERKKRITDYYSKAFAKHLYSLDANAPSEKALKSVNAKINDTGSDLPRALLAYYYSILQTIREHSTTTFCPIVIDSPNQQEQDDDHIKKMIEFIFNEKPKSSQLILGAVKLYGVKAPGKVIELKEKRSLLLESEYEKTLEMVRPLLDRTFGKKLNLTD